MIKIRLLAFLRNLTLTNDLQNVFIFVQFYNSNNMSLKVSKTKLIYISSRHKQLYMTNDENPINLSDSKLIPTSVENLLGVTIINSLCWDNHINQVLKKCNFYSFLLSRINIFLTRKKNKLILQSPYSSPS